MTGQEDTSTKSVTGAYLESDYFRSGSLRLPNKPFNLNYRIPQGTGYTLINGDHITKIIVTQVELGKWQVTLKLSDGTEHIIGPSDWTSQFVANNRSDT